jgi:hypothetical protein
MRLIVAVVAAAAGFASAFLFPAPVRAADARAFAANRERLERMTRSQRVEVWRRYHEFLALPKSEQDRMRKLSADIQSLPSEKRERYRSMIEQYRKWREGLPLYQRQQLEDAAQQGSVALYNKFREVQKYQEFDDQQRPYWLLPVGPALRGNLPNVLAKLTPEQIEQLDQTSPLDRGEKLMEYAQQQGLLPAGPGPMRSPRFRGPLPPVDQQRIFEFRKNLSKQQLDELNDPSLAPNMRHRRVLEWYYERHPELLPDGFRRGDVPGARGPGDRPPRKDGPGMDGRTQRPPAERKDEPRPPGGIGIKPREQ